MLVGVKARTPTITLKKKKFRLRVVLGRKVTKEKDIKEEGMEEDMTEDRDSSDMVVGLGRDSGREETCSRADRQAAGD